MNIESRYQKRSELNKKTIVDEVAWQHGQSTETKWVYFYCGAGVNDSFLWNVLRWESYTDHS